MHWWNSSQGSLSLMCSRVCRPPCGPENSCCFVAGQNLKPEDVAELQRMAENVALVADRRAAFVSLFLDPDETAQ